jgi:rubredoxin
MNDRCQFVYNGHTGPTGKVCSRFESEHCKEKPGTGDCAHKPGKAVHHTFTRQFKCPTCGTREVVA